MHDVIHSWLLVVTIQIYVRRIFPQTILLVELLGLSIDDHLLEQVVVFSLVIIVDGVGAVCRHLVREVLI